MERSVLYADAPRYRTIPCPTNSPPITPNPVIDAYKPGIDMTLIRENLKLTPTERLEKLQRLVEGIRALNAEGKAHRQRLRAEDEAS